MAKEFAAFMKDLREEPIEKRIDEVSDILTKVMTIVVSAIDDINQKIANMELNLTNMGNSNAQMNRELQEIKARGIPAPVAGAPVVKPMSPTPQTPAVPAPKPLQAPANPMTARSAINSELKALFSRKKKED